MDYDIVEDGVDHPGVQGAVFGLMQSRYGSGKNILELGLGVSIKKNN